jgi:hypothetical protein
MHIVVRQHRAARLEDNVTRVILLIYIMDGDATLTAARIKHRTVNPVAVHSLPPETGQQSRMNIDDAPPECLNEGSRNQPEKTRQDNQVNLPPLKHHQHLPGVIKLASVEKKGIDPECRSPLQNQGLRTIRQNKGNFRPIIVRKVSYYVFSVRPGSGSENGYIPHYLSLNTLSARIPRSVNILTNLLLTCILDLQVCKFPENCLKNMVQIYFFA